MRLLYTIVGILMCVIIGVIMYLTLGGYSV